MAAAVQATTHGTQQGQMSPCAKTSVRVSRAIDPRKQGFWRRPAGQPGNLAPRIIMEVGAPFAFPANAETGYKVKEGAPVVARTRTADTSPAKLIS
jgi:hypothetical protein